MATTVTIYRLCVDGDMENTMTATRNKGVFFPEQASRHLVKQRLLQ